MKNTIRQLLTVIFITTSTCMYAQGGIYDTASTNTAPPSVRLSETYDESTGTLSRETSLQYIGDWKEENGLYFSLKRKTSPLFDIYILIVIPTHSLGCSGLPGNYVNFFYEDGSVHTISGDFAETSCSDIAGSIFAFRNMPLKPIKKVIFSRMDEQIDADWNCKYSIQELADALK